MTDIDIDHLKTWIGREEEASDTIDTRLAASFLATLDRDPSDAVEGAPAPLCIHWCLAPAVVPNSATGTDGHPARGGFLPPVPLPRRMWAGGELRFHEALRIGDEVTRRSRIEKVELKEGRSGRLCFVTVKHMIETAAGLALDEQQDIVYRDADPAKPQAERPAPAPASEASTATPDAQVRETFDASTLALFRYSALTFNGHRIHYDRRYAIEEEGYGDLVVHGPLQATLLCRLAADTLGRTPSRFAYRGVKPLFAGSSLILNANRENDEIDLWSSSDDGAARMKASAR